MEEIELIRQYQEDGNEAAFERLLNNYMGLIVKEARNLCPKDEVLFDDFVQVGIIGFEKALRNYDIEKATPLIRYVSDYIKGGMISYSMENFYTGIPQSTVRKYQYYRNAELEFEQDYGYRPSFEELADELGDVTPLEIQETYLLCQNVGVKSQEVIEQTLSNEDVEEKSDNDESIFQKYEDILRPIEYEVCVLLEGSRLNSSENPYKDVMKHIPLSEYKIRLIECRAIRKIKKHIGKEQ